jgi:hypothetical protein
MLWEYPYAEIMRMLIDQPSFETDDKTSPQKEKVVDHDGLIASLMNFQSNLPR